MLKGGLISPQVLQYPDYTKQFILTTDASKQACGAILSQKHNSIELPIPYASRSFTRGEANKSTIEKELASIHWTINYFRPYLYGQKFVVKSDHRLLVYLFSMKNPSSKLTRMEFEFEILCIKGSENVDVDALSRIDVKQLIEVRDNISQILAVTRSMTKS